MSVRLYGRLIGHGSHAVVTRGFIEALGDELSGIVALDASASDADLGIAPLHPLQEQGAFAEHGVFLGPLNQLPAMVRACEHKRRWVMVAPNSTHVPPSLVRMVSDIATDILTPSQWAAGILGPIFPKHPIHVVPHGVDRAYAPRETAWLENEWDEGRGSILHFSTTEGERKGTWELYQAWAQLAPEFKHVRLTMVLDPAAEMRLRERILELEKPIPQRLELHTRLNWPAATMRSAYDVAHLVCQPSRGEAFGLIPLEALCCGTPVCITECTGHSQYVSGMPPTFNIGLRPLGIRVIPTGELAPIDDGPNALAPALSVQAIADTLSVALRDWRELYKQAQHGSSLWYEGWSWPKALAQWMQQL